MRNNFWILIALAWGVLGYYYSWTQTAQPHGLICFGVATIMVFLIGKDK